ncbi:class I SAM-dependent methyltransferase [Oceanivirga miroungae]|uniref:Methyltransferase small n=1 Tax=Oceanivirga miroungae TaxID=1130046 RepID=A0A6I8M9H6_9FUSO|nr:methyltransferase [Oceanivirga miroungae]VWL84918.1 methyltransferase small [Oceanivirga miroungae]
MEHYFTENPDVISKKREISYNFNNINFKFITDNGVFSKAHVDTGTEILIKSFLKYNDLDKFSFLDFGCAYGAVGIIVAKFYENSKITFLDINNRALDLAAENIKLNKIKNKVNLVQSDILSNADDTFDVILLNPPIRAGKETIFEMYKKSYEHLNKNSYLYVVIMTKHGAKSTEKELLNIFDEVVCINKDKGYRVYKAKKL